MRYYHLESPCYHSHILHLPCTCLIQKFRLIFRTRIQFILQFLIYRYYFPSCHPFPHLASFLHATFCLLPKSLGVKLTRERMLPLFWIFVNFLILTLSPTDLQQFVNYSWNFLTTILVPTEKIFVPLFLLQLVVVFFFYLSCLESAVALDPQFSGDYVESCWFLVCLAFILLWKQKWDAWVLYMSDKIMISEVSFFKTKKT